MRHTFVASILSFVSALTLIQPSPAFSENRQDVQVSYVRVKDADLDRTTLPQRNLLKTLTETVWQELKKAPSRVNVDTAYGIASWFMDNDWAALAEAGKTHFIIAIPQVTNDGEGDDFIKVSWEVGAIGKIAGQRVPVFAGSLPNVAGAKIIRTSTGAAIENGKVEAKASAVADLMRQIFPELGPAYSYYVSCLEMDQAPPIWSERRQRVLTRLLSQLISRNELVHARDETIDPSDEARSVCQDDPEKRAAIARKADFLLRGVTSNLPPSRVEVRVFVQNRPGTRRVSNKLTYQSNALSAAFNKQVSEWGSKYEGNTAWELFVCGQSPEFWGPDPKLDSFADALATVFQEKLSIDVAATVDRRICR